MNLYNGDCLEIMPTIEDGSVDMVLCDLPYGTTACKWDSVIPFEPLWREYRRLVRRNSAIVLTACQPFTSALVASNYKAFKYDVVWDKVKGTGFLNAKKRPMRNHESVLIFSFGRIPYNPQMTSGHERKTTFRAKHLQTDVYDAMANDYHYDSTDRYPRSVITISTDTQNSSLHPTQKPVALMEYFILTHTKPGDTVLDNTMGSGTTGVACRNTGRNFIGIERDAEYFAIAERRINGATSRPVAAKAQPANDNVQRGLFDAA